jgi:ABC-type nitrate/sulfonate/bicarbonate transport system substrate-binding protein
LGLVVMVTTPAQSQPLTSATINWIGDSSYYVADKKGLFKVSGLDVKEVFSPSVSKAFVAFNKGNPNNIIGNLQLTIQGATEF